MNRFATASLVFLLLAAGGCSSSLPNLSSTGSIFGSKPAPVQQTAQAAPTTDPATRALQVGSTSARAVKCGYNFDPQKLKASYLAYEIGLGATDQDRARIEQIYDVAYNGVTKAAAEEPQYCNETRTKEIKAALTRHLAGDFTPVQTKIVAKDDGGIFSGWGNSSGKDDGLNLKLPTDNR